MRQKILVALDDSPNAMRAVEQVARTYTIDNEITLYSVIPQVDFGCRLTPIADRQAACGSYKILYLVRQNSDFGRRGPENFPIGQEVFFAYGADARVCNECNFHFPKTLLTRICHSILSGRVYASGSM